MATAAAATHIIQQGKIAGFIEMEGFSGRRDKHLKC